MVFKRLEIVHQLLNKDQSELKFPIKKGGFDGLVQSEKFLKKYTSTYVTHVDQLHNLYFFCAGDFSSSHKNHNLKMLKVYSSGLNKDTRTKKILPVHILKAWECYVCNKFIQLSMFLGLSSIQVSLIITKNFTICILLITSIQTLVNDIFFDTTQSL